MNPVLLKPESETGSQVIVQGRHKATVRAQDYLGLRSTLLAPVLDSFQYLVANHDLVIVEGAGSPAEVNLREGDIANMGFARAANVPVVLAGDIDRGGVVAQLIGTQAVLEVDDAALIKGFMVNKFRGDPKLFNTGYEFIQSRTGWRGFGVLPFLPDAGRLPAEDAQDLRRAWKDGNGFQIACLALSRIANFDDLDPLRAEPGVFARLIAPGEAIPGDIDLVIIPGSKSTRGDLTFLRNQGWDIDLRAHYRRGGMILGICGGYQMMGRVVADPEGMEGLPGEDPGLNFFDLVTVMAPQKRLGLLQAVHAASRRQFEGYEIHLGRSEGPGRALPFAYVNGQPEGAVSMDGRLMGSYLHGMFANDGFRRAFLAAAGKRTQERNHAGEIEALLDALALHLEVHLDVEGLLSLRA
jgi:adenosylcobyric acid synthase